MIIMIVLLNGGPLKSIDLPHRIVYLHVVWRAEISIVTVIGI